MSLAGLLAPSFGGGHRFRRFRGQHGAEVVQPDLPAEVVVPLLSGFGVAVPALVEPGQAVLAGQVIGRSDETVSSPAHATVNGKVTAIESVTLRDRAVQCVRIATAPGLEWQALSGASADWQKLDPARIEELVYLSGAAALSPEGIPTRFRSSTIAPESVTDVIVHHTNCEPFDLSAELLLSGREADFAAGLAILKRFLPNARIHVALDAEQTALHGRLRSVLDAAPLPVQARYPQSAPEMLVHVVLKREFPFGWPASSIGVITMDFPAVLAVFEAVTAGKPVIERLVSFAGPSATGSVHLRARVGTPLQILLGGRLAPDARVVLDSALAGWPVDDLGVPLERTASRLMALKLGARRVPFAFARPGWRQESWTRGFAAWYADTQKIADTNLHGDERPCVQCGYCARVCPVRVIPSLVSRLLRLGVNEDLVRYDVFNCIDCGLCTFVCPSKIPLAEHVKRAKSELLAVGCDNSSCIVPKFELRGAEEYKGVKSVR
jgi:Na(+)-translocating NADH:ubiquinone oxidoreductase A subunit